MLLTQAREVTVNAGEVVTIRDLLKSRPNESPLRHNQSLRGREA